MSPTRRQLRAFTLMELVLLMVIITVVLGVAAPTMNGFGRGQKTKDATLEMLAVLKEARTRAIAEARIYRVMLNYPAQDQYQACMLDQGAPTDIGTELGKVRRMPEDTHFTVTRPDKGPAQYLDFYPSGRVDVAQITITPPRGEPTKIVCDSPTEGYRIPSSEEPSR